MISNFLYHNQRNIQSPIKHLRWSFLRKQLTASIIQYTILNTEYFRKKAPSWIFDLVMNTPLIIIVIQKTQGESRKAKPQITQEMREINLSFFLFPFSIFGYTDFLIFSETFLTIANAPLNRRLFFSSYHLLV